MATTFIESPILSGSTVPTADADSIKVSTTETKLAVSLSCGGITFFSADLYAYNGVVELFDPGTLIEDHFRARGLTMAPVVITFGDTSAEATFIYCEQLFIADFSPSKNFLLSSSVRRVHRGSVVRLAAAPAQANANFIIKAVGHDSSGYITSFSYTSIRPIPDSLYTELDVDNMIKTLLNIEEKPLVDVIYFAVTLGKRQLLCYITPSPAYLTFCFRNVFNIPELLDVEGVMVTKTETSRDSASCRGRIVQYDRKTDRTYQVTTGPVTAEEAESYEQLIASHQAQVMVNGTPYDIAIEDHTCEQSTADDTLTAYKFTWRFTGRRPVKFESEMFGVAPSNRGVFSAEYSDEYD